MENYILVYDDEESILEVIRIILEQEGYKVITSTKGEDVFNDIDKYHPSLILLDIWMKGTNGNEIAKQLKANESTKAIPVLLISALNETEDIAAQAGADGFLKKPFDMDILLEIIKEKLSRSIILA